MMKKRYLPKKTLTVVCTALSLLISIPASAGVAESESLPVDAAADEEEKITIDVLTTEDAIKVPESAAADEDEAEGTDQSGELKVSRIRFADSYEEIFKALEGARNYYRYYNDFDVVVEEEKYYEGEALEETLVGAAAENKAASYSDSEAGADYSETNVRTEGVDEADVVKTDGSCIYILQNGTDLKVVKADSGTMQQLSTIHLMDVEGWYNAGAKEFFVQNGTLHVICEDQKSLDQSSYYDSRNRITRVMTYDVSDPASPVKTGDYWQDGSYLQARYTGGVLYLFTRVWPELGSDVESSRLSVEAGGSEIGPERFCIPDIVTDESYLVVSSLDPKRPSDCQDCKVLISGAAMLYVSTESIYAINVDYSGSHEKSEIVKFTYSDGAITGKAAGTIRGSIKDTFSIDEYNGYLRVLTTYMGSIRNSLLEAISDFFGFYYDGDRWTRHNALFVLDEDMHVKGRIVDLAEGEDIRSARYFGDTAYFVTFRNTDPLFTVDLSDPASPKILGTLKIPGFSSYLHPFGENRLLGLGYEADEKNGATSGIKLSIFDLTNPEDVFESDRTVIDRVTYLPALDDYKAIFADAGKQLVGFYLNDRYLVYHLREDGGFERVLLYDFFTDSLQGLTDYSRMRALYIGDTFYLAGSGYVAAFDMGNEFAPLAVLRLS